MFVPTRTGLGDAYCPVIRSKHAYKEGLMDASLPVLCGVLSTLVFVGGTLPMLVKAFRTRDLSSYSLGNILMSNVGNAVNWVYVTSLPPGPVWWLHGFYTVTTALMLFWYVRYSLRPADRRTQISPSGIDGELHSSPDADVLEELLASSH
jgi:hypothetical protein